MSEQLQTQEQERFHELEVVIEEGRNAWLQVGCAIWEIRERKLYRENYKTFEAYCASRWGWSKRHCDQIASASQILKEVTKDSGVLGSVVPKTISIKAAIELGRAAPEDRPEVIARAIPIGGGKVTVKTIRAALPPPRSTTPLPASTAVTDSIGVAIPATLIGFWDRGAEIREILGYITAIRARVKKAEENDDLLFAEVGESGFSVIRASLNDAWLNIKRAIPYAVCTLCQGVDTDGCTECKGRGFISELFWERCVPEEKKKMRTSK